MRCALWLLAPALAVAGGNGAATDEDLPRQTLSMINNAGRVITALNLSPANEDNWGPNILSDGDIPVGETRQVTFGRATGSCLTDIPITYQGGDTSEVSDVNFCGITAVSLSRWP